MSEMNLGKYRPVYHDKKGRFASIKAKVVKFFSWVWFLVKMSVALAVVVFGVHLYDQYDNGSNVAYAENIVVNKIVEKREFPPMLKKICTAESGGHQFLPNGHVVRGHVNPSDIGECQINEPIWNDKARDLGFDIYTQDGNEKMAMWLFDHKGTEPWNSSKPIWNK